MTGTREILVGVQEGHLASIVDAVHRIEGNSFSLPDRIRISIVRNYTIEGILPLLKFHCYKCDLQPYVHVGNYDNVRQEILDPLSHVHQGPVDILVISLWLSQLDPPSNLNDWEPELTLDSLFSLFNDAKHRVTSPIVLNTFLPPLYVENGLATSKDKRDRRAKVRWLNQQIMDFAKQNDGQFFVVDWERLLCLVGWDRAIDMRFWSLYKSPFRTEFLDLYAREIVTIARALKGKAKKCLILDCDNTLWGGIVGEEGLDGITLDKIEYPGKCYHDFQRVIINLVERGVVVALCSKNNEEDVLEVLDRHPQCLLKRGHLAAWRINWNSKPDNIRSLALDLNLGLDSFVFVDDSAMECHAVRESLPQVTVLQVPEKLYDLPELVLRDAWFDTLSLHEEDSLRTQTYQAEQERNALHGKFDTLDGFLTSLGITAVIHRMIDSEISRVAQLTGKTNQFNLTTRRYSEADIRKFADDSDMAIYTMTAGDRFGALGLIAVCIARRREMVCSIDTLLMSCRALGRKLEYAFVEEGLSSLERLWNITDWKAEFLPTRKNQQVESFWESVGFACVEKTEGGKRYSVSVKSRPRTEISHIVISSA